MHRSTLVVLSLFVAACGSRKGDTDPEGLPPDDTDGFECDSDDDCDSDSICEGQSCEYGDRNDELESAEALIWSDLVEGEINPTGDVDWYTIQAEGGEFFRISVVTAEDEGGLDSVVSVYTEGGKRLVWEDGHPAGNVSSADSMCFGYFPVAGTYSIKVEDIGSFEGTTPIGGSGESYTLVVEEWNSVVVDPDSAQEAGLEFGDVSEDILYSFPVLLEEAGDTDWASLTLPAAGAPIYVLALEHADESELVAQVSMRNAAGDDVLARTSPTASAPAMLPNPEGTRYVIGATDASGGGGSDFWTWLFFIVREAGSGSTPEIEPDDSIEDANIVTLEDQEPDSGEFWSAHRQGRIETDTDVDTYTFEVYFDDAYISFVVGAEPYGSLLVPRLELLDSTGNVLDTVDSTAGSDEDALNLGPYPRGDYSLRVSPTPDSGAVGGEGYFYLVGMYATSSLVE